MASMGQEGVCGEDEGIVTGREAWRLSLAQRESATMLQQMTADSICGYASLEEEEYEGGSVTAAALTTSAAMNSTLRPEIRRAACSEPGGQERLVRFVCGTLVVSYCQTKQLVS